MGLSDSESDVVAPDGTTGVVVAGPDFQQRVKVEWDDGTVSWSQRALLESLDGEAA